MSKQKIDDLKKNVAEMKDKAEKISKEAIKTANTVKGTLQNAIQKEKIGQGIEVTSKGMELVAKGAKIAAVGAEGLARGMEKASQSMRHLSEKLRGKS